MNETKQNHKTEGEQKMKKLTVFGLLVVSFLCYSANAFAWYNTDYSSGQETYYSPNLSGGYNVSTPSGNESVFNPTLNGNTYSESY